jgi:hypothetical protein
MKRILAFAVAAALSTLFAANAAAQWCPPGQFWNSGHCVLDPMWKKGKRRFFKNEWGFSCTRPAKCTICCETPLGGSYCEYDEGRCGQ